MSEWDDKLEFLKSIRKDWCNSDYIEFLVEKVWCINDPVKVVDFGCGYGYICDLLMPLLPAGSTYTGIDNSNELIKAARKHLAHYEFEVNFVYADLLEYIPEEKYDLAICNAVLRHIPNPVKILEKMKNSVVKNGLVICFEVDRPIEEIGFYCSEIDNYSLGQSELYRKMCDYEYTTGGRDYRVGIKMPKFMQEIGLQNVSVRMNDSVKFASPVLDNYEEKRRMFAAGKGYYEILKNPDVLPPLAVALTDKEKKKFLDNQQKIASTVVNGEGYLIQTPCVLISYGWKL
ncbi:class I SAM-dependent methyltransferase [Anaerocolumna aminovalerica]|jgi:SAM-dependent methyltransferase|uniref:Methyltransferase domain-containing protein n=1 Tax=Anaerocolumna aminovalerica TaxID=1527 RepID=A0A1I5CFL2_9FIRM|nr:class I SAM-dependent methyltransferase [Anaerocolumna aminovalerica]MBU5334643.1 class I SAM-dependent methyltransferase [Anaerocolumna aminovalerica]MDU6265201.1 class I SAM-dependent methyltransferase [Anaerocolumna aminovalerica]SFN85707.1 Methyltransferase domain-containing protein [Anaerocolumna aminovalerica]